MPRLPKDPQTRAAARMRQALVVGSFRDRLFELRWWLLAAVGLLILGFIAGLLVVRLIKPAATGDEAELKTVQAKIAKHFLLPTDETPALATVTDKSKLTSPIFKSAQNGDKILIYQKNKLAIIYRPGVDRIVATGPVAIDAPPNGGGNNQ